MALSDNDESKDWQRVIEAAFESSVSRPDFTADVAHLTTTELPAPQLGRYVQFFLHLNRPDPTTLNTARPDSKLLQELVGDFDPVLYDNFAYAQAELDSIANRKHWFVKVSGGKDSSLLYLHVNEYVCRRPESGITITVICNDTLLEAPALVPHVHNLLAYGQALCDAAGVTHKVIITKPALEDRFWVMCLGHGYPPFNRRFRPCTTRMKIMPSEAIMKHLLQEQGVPSSDMALLLGVRQSESREREERYAEGGHHQRKAHGGIDACVRGEGECGQLTAKGTAFTEDLAELGIAEAYPILTTHTDKVWDALMYVYGPLGWPVTKLESEVYVERNVRHGCWMCPLVKKVRDIECLFTLEGYEWVHKLLTFRSDYLREAARDENRLHVIHPEGRVITKGKNKGKPRPGGRQKTGLTLDFRQRWFERLVALDAEIYSISGYRLIEPEEVEYIRCLWEREKATGKRGKSGMGKGS